MRQQGQQPRKPHNVGGFLNVPERYLNCHPFLPVFNHFYPFSIPLVSAPWGGAFSAVRAKCKRIAIIWVCGRTRDFVILGGIIVV